MKINIPRRDYGLNTIMDIELSQHCRNVGLDGGFGNMQSES